LLDLEVRSGDVTQSAIDCWQVPCAPATPLFLSITAAIKELLSSARRRARKDRDNELTEVSALEKELNAIHRIIEDASSTSTRWTYLIRVIRAIETNDDAWENWQLDLLKVSTGFHQRSSAELKLLKHLSEGIVAVARGAFKSTDVATYRDVCLWIMLHSRLRRELGDTAALLDFVKGLVPESRIDEICDNLIRNMRGSEPLRDAREQQLHGKKLSTTERAVAMILSSGFDEMWHRLYSLRERDLAYWMSRMRVLLSIIPSVLAEAARLLSPESFCR
jgi:hypothetical protein